MVCMEPKHWRRFWCLWIRMKKVSTDARRCSKRCGGWGGEELNSCSEVKWWWWGIKWESIEKKGADIKAIPENFIWSDLIWSCQRVDSVIESSLREIIGSKNFALINLSLNFCETTTYENKVFLQNYVAVH